MDKKVLSDQAIQEALRGNWQEAIKINAQLLKDNKSDCEILNRLGQAYKNVGNLKKAASVYQKVIKIDKYNSIALRNLEMLKNSKANLSSCQKAIMVANTGIFLEEPGKTKLVALVNIAPASKILSISPRQILNMAIKRKAVFIEDQDNNYIGALPDDLSYRLIRFMKAGYKYEFYAKTVEKNYFVVLIREIQRSKRLNNQPTFPLGINEHDFLAINAPELIIQTPEIEDKSDSYSPKELVQEPDSQETLVNDDGDD